MDLKELLQQKTKSSPWYYRSIRKITTSNYGVTIPTNIAYQFLDVKMTIKSSGNSIILTKSGAGD